MLVADQATFAWISPSNCCIGELLDRTSSGIRHWAPKASSRELAEFLSVNPCCRISDVVEARIANRQTGTGHLHEGILEEAKTRREKVDVNRPLSELLFDNA